MARRLPQLAAALCLVFALSGSSAAAVDPDGPSFHVVVGDADYPALELELRNVTRAGFVGHVTIEAPAGFNLYPDRLPGSPIGEGVAYAVDESFNSTGLSLMHGQIVAAELDATAKATGRACAGSVEPVALWTFRLSVVGQPVDIPIYLSQDGERTRLDLCVPRITPSAPLLPLVQMHLLFPDLSPPRTTGSYVWSAVVTPAAPDHRNLAPEQAYELRALVPVPHAVTLRGRYDARRHQVVLRGRVTAAGKPREHVRVAFTGFIRKVTSHGIDYDDFFAGSALTNAAGSFSFRHRLTRTTGFYAVVDDVTGPCDGTAAAPGGCLSTTTSGAAGEPITVSVPRRR
jgi:hypothetical protein